MALAPDAVVFDAVALALTPAAVEKLPEAVDAAPKADALCADALAPRPMAVVSPPLANDCVPMADALIPVACEPDPMAVELLELARARLPIAVASLPVAVPPEADFSQLRPATNWKVDNCFTGWGRRAVLDYPTHRVQIDASEACHQIVVFAPNDGRNFIALEPVTHINNAFALAAKGVADTGMRMLASAASLEMSMSIGLTGRAAAKATHA